MAASISQEYPNDTSFSLSLQEQNDYEDILVELPGGEVPQGTLKTVMQTIFDIISYRAEDYMEKWNTSNVKTKDYFKPVIDKVVWDAEYLLSSITGRPSAKFKDNINEADSELIVHIFNDLETLKYHSNTANELRRNNWFQLSNVINLDTFVLRYIRYKIWYLGHYIETKTIGGEQTPDLKVIGRTIKEVRIAMDARAMTLNLIASKSPSQLTKKILKLIDIPIKNINEIVTPGNRDESIIKDIKYLEKGAMDIMKGVIWGIVCYTMELHLCASIFGGLVGIELLIWIVILSRILVIEFGQN